MRSLVQATFIILIAQSWVACDKKKSDGKPRTAAEATIADQVGNTRTQNEVAQGWIQTADQIKNKVQSIDSKTASALYLASPEPVQDCLSPKATYSSVKNTSSGVSHPVYFRCDARPACQMLIAKFKEDEQRSWPVVTSEELYILAQFVKEAELLVVTDACGSAETMATNIANYGISDLGYTFQNISETDFANLLQVKNAPNAADDTSTVEEEDEYFLLGFESIENDQVVSTGYVGMKGDAEKVVAQVSAKIADNSIDPMVETLLSDLILNKVYFNSSKGSSVEFDGKITKMRDNLTLVFDVPAYTVNFDSTNYENGSISYEGSGSIQLKDGVELVRIARDSQGDNSVQRIRKDLQSAQCKISAN